MNSRTSFYVLIFLIIFALISIWFYSRQPDPEPLLVLPATIDHDCAPWDGSAFTVSIPFEEGNLNISIYQPPDIKHPLSFSLNEGTQEIGHAIFLPTVGSPEPVTGNVSFEHVEDSIAVDGKYQLRTESGKEFLGKFKAEWGEAIVYCG